jgi:hypothetical protein
MEVPQWCPHRRPPARVPLSRFLLSPPHPPPAYEACASKSCPPHRLGTDAGQRDCMVEFEASSSTGIQQLRKGSNHLSSQHYQAIFHSIFEFISTFSAQHLFAIGLSPSFCFGWSLPPNSAYTLAVCTAAAATERPKRLCPGQRAGPAHGNGDSD